MPLGSAKTLFRSALTDYVADDSVGERDSSRRRPQRPPAPTARPTRPAPSRSRPATRRPTTCSDPADEPRDLVTAAVGAGGRASNPVRVTGADGAEFELDHGAVVIAAITSCTNTSNPQVMIGAALLARNAVEKGLTRKPWVKTTLAPGLQGRHGLLRAGRPHAVPGQARLQPGRLRLHHLHRQLRPAAGGGLAPRSTSTTWRSSRCSPATATSRAGSTRTSR